MNGAQCYYAVIVVRDEKRFLNLHTHTHPVVYSVFCLYLTGARSCTIQRFVLSPTFWSTGCAGWVGWSERVGWGGRPAATFYTGLGK